MAFTVHCGADLYGRKDNVEIVFGAKPGLQELYQRVHHVFLAELGSGATFSIEQVRIYDEVLGRWVDLTHEDQLHPFAQLYAFQPDSAYQCDLRGLIPAPRRTQAGNVVPGAHPAEPMQAHREQDKERERHVAIAQHLNQQLGGPGAQGSPAAYSTPPHQSYPRPQPVAAPQGFPQPPLNVCSPSEYSPIQAAAGSGGPQRWVATEPEAHKEQARHRDIAQHLHQQLASPAQQTTPQHMNLAPAATPMQPSPLTYMPAPQYGAFSPQAPPQPFSPATPHGLLAGGQMDDQAAAKERERHRMVSGHLSQQLAHQQSPHSPQTPMYGVAPPVNSPAGALPGVDPAQAAADAEKERQRHQLIAQHLNQHLQAASPL